jgi:hypothetical protein
MEISINGFRQTGSLRHYLFQTVAADRVRHDVVVDADLNLMRHHGISIQEMPLLCRKLIEAIEGVPPSRMIYSEQSMAGHARDRAAAQVALALRKRPRPKFVRRDAPQPLGAHRVI